MVGGLRGWFGGASPEGDAVEAGGWEGALTETDVVPGDGGGAP
jgi:hypothetical protein